LWLTTTPPVPAPPPRMFVSCAPVEPGTEDSRTAPATAKRAQKAALRMAKTRGREKKAKQKKKKERKKKKPGSQKKERESFVPFFFFFQIWLVFFFFVFFSAGFFLFVCLFLDDV
jgi:hypothetical protein